MMNSRSAATLVFINDSLGRMEQQARTALALLASGPELADLADLTHRLLHWTPLNVIDLRRRLATRLCAVGSYRALVTAK